MTLLLTCYVLVWPVIVLGVLCTIATAFVRELRKARKDGTMII